MYVCVTLHVGVYYAYMDVAKLIMHVRTYIYICFRIVLVSYLYVMTLLVLCNL